MLLESLTIRPYIENDSIRNVYIYKNAGARMSLCVCSSTRDASKKSFYLGLFLFCSRYIEMVSTMVFLTKRYFFFFIQSLKTKFAYRVSRITRRIT